MNKKKRADTAWIVKMGILLAIMLIFAFTSLGYIKIGVVEITLMVLPVAVGAVVLGPAAGAILGAMFGITSLIQCFGISAFGTVMFSLNPIGFSITCLIPRVLCGLIPALIFSLLKKNGRTGVVSVLVCSVLTALLNTILFMSCILIFFWHNDSFLGVMSDWGITVDSIWLFLVAFVGINGIIEAIVNAVAATAVSRVLIKVEKRHN